MSGWQGWRELVCRAWSALVRGPRTEGATESGPGTDGAAATSPAERDARVTESRERTLRQSALEGARADDSVRMVFAKALTTTPVALVLAWRVGGLPATLCSLAGAALLTALFISVGRRIRLARRAQDLSDSDDRGSQAGR